MKKIIIKITVFVILFIISTIICSRLANKSNIELTSEMSSPSLPVICIEYDGEDINYLQAHALEMDTRYQRDTITPIDNSRKIRVKILEVDTVPASLSYEVTTIDESRLVESNLAELTEDGYGYYSDIAIKDLIIAEYEYMLKLILELENGEKYYYYTKIIEMSESHTSEKIEFVRDFHNNTFDKSKDREIIPYIEPNHYLDSNNLNYVDIHSDLNQIMWGRLEVQKYGEEVFKLVENSKQTAAVTIKYMVNIKRNNNQIAHIVEEYYRVRYTKDRMYLLDFKRVMEEIPDIETLEITNNKIMLGVANEDLQMVESIGGDMVAFQSANTLFTYNSIENKISCLYNYFPKESPDVRNYMNYNKIKILNVEESGNVRFLTYGYKNYGKNEAEIGIQLYYYDSSLNAINEELYIPYSKSEKILAWNVEQLSYISRNNKLYIFLDSAIYEIDVATKEYKIIVSNISTDDYFISNSNQMIVWEEKSDEDWATALKLMDLNTCKITEIKAGSNEYIKAYGFVENDLVYGVSRISDGQKNKNGKLTYPNYSIRIQGIDSNVLKNYNEEGIHIVNCQIYENYINLNRVRFDDEGLTYEDIEDDQIVHNKEEVRFINCLEVVTTLNFYDIVQLVLESKVQSENITSSIPEVTLYEGDRKVDINQDSDNSLYYVYKEGEIKDIYSKINFAVNSADEIAGVVVNEKGDLLWESGNTVVKNQIMKIKENEDINTEMEVAQCVNKILEFEGIYVNSSSKFLQGGTATDVLTKYLPEYTILDLEGVSLDNIIFYLNKDLPILVLLENEEAVLLTGFNQNEIVVYHPSSGKLEKEKKEVLKEIYERNGNQFITYFPNDMENR